MAVLEAAGFAKTGSKTEATFGLCCLPVKRRVNGESVCAAHQGQLRRSGVLVMIPAGQGADDRIDGELQGARDD